MIKRRVFSGILVMGCIWVGADSYPQLLTLAAAQTQPQDDLFYTFYDKRIPLNLRQDAIAVAFKDVRARGENQPLYLQLQQDLQSGGTRGSALNVEVKPLGDRYALIKLPSGTRSPRSAIKQRTEQQPYVESTLPVMRRGDRDELIVVPNEIVVSFESKFSESQQQAIFDRHNLKVIRPLRFSQNRYLVISSASGTAVLGVANRLNEVIGVKSATPNFIQSPADETSETIDDTPVSEIPKIPDRLTKSRASFPLASQTPSQTTLLPLQWHLNSTPLIVCLNQPAPQSKSLDVCLKNPLLQSNSLPPRTDIRATDAWQQTSGGRGVLVAVLDSLIQWDHPDLAESVHSIGKVKDKLPGEIHGWDFADDDPDTRISQAELARQRPFFQDTFRLSDAKLLQEYPELAKSVKQASPNYSPKQIASVARDSVRMYTAALFHGTWVSGVIAAHSQGGQGLVGVAPHAQILPVSVGKEGPSAEAIVEGIGYAAARGADVINMSFGFSTFLPVEDIADQILVVQQDNPNLVFVAAAGNNNSPEVGFPATMQGVISVGATSLTGNRAPYSDFGSGLDVAAPGGDVRQQLGPLGGILTTGGTWVAGFWQGMPVPKSNWSTSLDPQGKYMWVNGTSFASPAVAGVVALMQGEDPERRLNRDRLTAILKQTASHEGLAVSEEELKLYRLLLKATQLPPSVSPQRYFFGSGLVNAEAAVREVKRSR